LRDENRLEGIEVHILASTAAVKGKDGRTAIIEKGKTTEEESKKGTSCLLDCPQSKRPVAHSRAVDDAIQPTIRIKKVAPKGKKNILKKGGDRQKGGNWTTTGRGDCMSSDGTRDKSRRGAHQSLEGGGEKGGGEGKAGVSQDRKKPSLKDHLPKRSPFKARERVPGKNKKEKRGLAWKKTEKSKQHPG